MDPLSKVAFVLGGWANSLPAVARKRIYKTVKFLAGLATLLLVVLPALPSLGVHLSEPERYAAILTGALALLGHLADYNTNPDTTLDLMPAPESSATADLYPPPGAMGQADVPEDVPGK